MGENFTDKDTGWNKFVTAFEISAGQSHALVGVTRSAGDYKKKGEGGSGEITVAQIAALMCYGSSDGTIPQRDFMTKAIEDNKEKIEKLVIKINQKILEGKLDRDKGLGILCQAIVDMMKTSINSGEFEPNKPSTIRRKKSDKPLVDTKQMANSLDWELKENEK